MCFCESNLTMKLGIFTTCLRTLKKKSMNYEMVPFGLLTYSSLWIFILVLINTWSEDLRLNYNQIITE